MGSTAQAWALYTAEPQNAVEKLVLFGLGSLCGDADPAAGMHTYDPHFSLEDLMAYSASSDILVRTALNSLADRGVISDVRQANQKNGNDAWICRLNVVFPPDHRW